MLTAMHDALWPFAIQDDRGTEHQEDPLTSHQVHGGDSVYQSGVLLAIMRTVAAEAYSSRSANIIETVRPQLSEGRPCTTYICHDAKGRTGHQTVN